MCNALQTSLTTLRRELNDAQLTLGGAAAALSQVDADRSAERANLLAWGAERLIELAKKNLDAIDAASGQLQRALTPPG